MPCLLIIYELINIIDQCTLGIVNWHTQSVIRCLLYRVSVIESFHCISFTWPKIKWNEMKWNEMELKLPHDEIIYVFGGGELCNCSTWSAFVVVVTSVSTCNHINAPHTHFDLVTWLPRKHTLDSFIIQMIVLINFQ